MSRIDDYNHLNETDPPRITLSMQELVRQVRSVNYGTHRFLSALVHEIRKREPQSKLAKGIEDLLNQGLF